MRSYRATSAWLVTSPPDPTPAFRKVTIDKRNATPTKMVAASRVREATRPSASCFVLFLEHGKQSDGGADAGEGHNDLQKATHEGGGVRARADDIVRAFNRVVQSERR